MEQNRTHIMATIAILGTMDTKGEEHAFVADLIRKRGHRTLVIDVGALETPRLEPDVTREEIAAAAGVALVTCRSPLILASRSEWYPAVDAGLAFLFQEIYLRLRRPPAASVATR